MGSLRVVTILLLLGSPAFAQSPTYGVGRTPTAEEIRRMDISIGPTGEELPAGRGTAKEGAKVFEQKGCMACHGEAGLGGLAPARLRTAAHSMRTSENEGALAAL
jgi:cytochrome c